MLDEERIVRADLDGHAGGQCGAKGIEFRADRIGDLDGVGVGLAKHAEPDRRFTVGADDGLIILGTALDISDIGKPDRESRRRA